MAKKTGIIVGGVVGAGLLVAAAGAFFAVQGDDNKEQPKSAAPTALFEKPAVLKAACTAAVDTGLTGIPDKTTAIQNCIDNGAPEIKQADNIPAVCSTFALAFGKGDPSKSTANQPASWIEMTDAPEVGKASQALETCSSLNAPPSNTTFWSRRAP